MTTPLSNAQATYGLLGRFASSPPSHQPLSLEDRLTAARAEVVHLERDLADRGAPQVGDWVYLKPGLSLSGLYKVIKRVTPLDSCHKDNSLYLEGDGTQSGGGWMWPHPWMRLATPAEVEARTGASQIKAGDWVVCLDDSLPNRGKERLTKGTLYKVEALGDANGYHLEGDPNGSWRGSRFRKATAHEIATLQPVIKVKGAGGIEYLAAIQLGWVQFGCAAITNVQLRAAHALFMDAEPTCAHYTSLNGGTLTGGRSFTKVWIGEGEFTWEVLEKLIPLLRD